MNMTIIAAASSAALAGAIGFGAAWTIQGRSIDALKLEAKDERIAIYRANRENLERITNQISQAQEDAQRRLSVLAGERDRAAESSRGLRDTSAAAVRTVAQSPATCGHITHAYDLILTENRDFIQALATDADQCSIERQTLSDAWPK